MKKARIIIRTLCIECPICDTPIANPSQPDAVVPVWLSRELIDLAIVTCNRCGIELEIPLTARIRDRVSS